MQCSLHITCTPDVGGPCRDMGPLLDACLSCVPRESAAKPKCCLPAAGG